MKKYNTLYYLLFVLIVMGAFASMAQNDYGISILGLAAASFSILFLIQLLSMFFDTERVSKSSVVELTSLFILAAILAMRVFYIRFPFVELVFGMAGLALVVVYLRKMIQAFSAVKPESKKLAWLAVIFYGSIVLYLISMVTVPFFPSLSEPAGIAAFVLLIIFCAVNLLSKSVLANGERISGIQFIARLKDSAGVLAVLFLLFTLYMGFSKIGVVPTMYSDEFPQSYYKLVKQAETGKEKPLNGKFKYEEFKEKYDLFVQRTAAEKK